MPFPTAESPDHVTNPLPAVTVDSDTIIAAVLAELHQPLMRHVAGCLQIDRMPNVPGSTPVPIAERAQTTADAAISDAAHALRQAGHMPTRGERMVRQFGVRLAERTVRRYLTDLEVSPESVDVAVRMLWNEEASSDRFRAVAQVSAAREPVDPPVLEPVEIPNAEPRS
jgi:hypothetical protein